MNQPQGSRHLLRHGASFRGLVTPSQRGFGALGRRTSNHFPGPGKALRDAAPARCGCYNRSGRGVMVPNSWGLQTPWVIPTNNTPITSKTIGLTEPWAHYEIFSPLHPLGFSLADSSCNQPSLESATNQPNQCCTNGCQRNTHCFCAEFLDNISFGQQKHDQTFHKCIQVLGMSRMWLAIPQDCSSFSFCISITLWSKRTLATVLDDIRPQVGQDGQKWWRCALMDRSVVTARENMSSNQSIMRRYLDKSQELKPNLRPFLIGIKR